jgi:hypothetical protein
MNNRADDDLRGSEIHIFWAEAEAQLTKNGARYRYRVVIPVTA